MLYYLPSCNFTRQFPETSAFLQDYASRVYGARVLGCCRILIRGMNAALTEGSPEDGLSLSPDLILQPGDTILTVCQNCSIMMREQLAALPFPVEERSIFELLAEDDSFPWPDLSGESYTLQDCCRAWDKPLVRAAVRKCLAHTKATIIELPEEEREENSLYCGTFLLDGPVPANVPFTPVYHRDIYPTFAAKARLIFPAEDIAQAKADMMEHQISLYQTEKVVGYCNRCVSSLRAAGIEAFHLAELIM